MYLHPAFRRCVFFVWCSIIYSTLQIIAKWSSVLQIATTPSQMLTNRLWRVFICEAITFLLPTEHLTQTQTAETDVPVLSAVICLSIFLYLWINWDTVFFSSVCILGFCFYLTTTRAGEDNSIHLPLPFTKIFDSWLAVLLKIKLLINLSFKQKAIRHNRKKLR